MNRNLTPRQLGEFVVGGIVFAILLGYLSFKKSGTFASPILIWIGGGTWGIFGLAFPRLTKHCFVVVTFLTYPFSWLFSRVILTLFFYGLITPTGILMRCLGHDLLQRKKLPKSTTYWVAHKPAKNRAQYFKQF